MEARRSRPSSIDTIDFCPFAAADGLRWTADGPLPSFPLTVDFGVKLYFTPQFRTSEGKVHKITWKKPHFTPQSRALGDKVHLNRLLLLTVD